jgi:uncharacterized membrane protein
MEFQIVIQVKITRNFIGLTLFCIFYVIAGINHFWHPGAYLDLIPPYMGHSAFYNFISGALEISGGLLMIIPATRKLSACLVILLLVAFIPAHIYLIQMKGCVSENLCVPGWVAWLRLFPCQFILMWWAWKTYRWNAI